MNQRRSGWMVVAVLALGAPLSAQMHGDGLGGRFGGRGGGGMGPPRFLEHVYPPQLVMRHQEDIGLTAEQRSAISNAMAETQKALVELQWQNEAEVAKLDKLLEPAVIDDKAAASQTDRVMEIEGKMKKTHLALLVRIKNILTAPQQARLRELRPARPAFALPGPPPEE